MSPESCCILNGGGGAWAFVSLAKQLSEAIGVEVSVTPREFNYLLQFDQPEQLPANSLFIPYSAMQLAADKRLVADAFRAGGVPTPETHLLPTWDEVQHFLNANTDREWCLKFPTGTGASGHRRLTAETRLPDRWPTPFVVQEFIRLERPEVYRTYIAGETIFGWVVRRFPAGVSPSPWVAHARGARYEVFPTTPEPARTTARLAFSATGLRSGFGCVDLIPRPTGEWLALEVGTDGLYNHVDRDLGNADFERELVRQIADAFWSRFGSWRPRR